LGPFVFWVFAVEDFASHSVYLKLIVAAFDGKRINSFWVLGFEGVDILREEFFFSRDLVVLGCVLVLVGNIVYLLD